MISKANNNIIDYIAGYINTLATKKIDTKSFNPT